MAQIIHMQRFIQPLLAPLLCRLFVPLLCEMFVPLLQDLFAAFLYDFFLRPWLSESFALLCGLFTSNCLHHYCRNCLRRCWVNWSYCPGNQAHECYCMFYESYRKEYWCGCSRCITLSSTHQLRAGPPELRLIFNIKIINVHHEDDDRSFELLQLYYHLSTTWRSSLSFNTKVIIAL